MGIFTKLKNGKLNEHKTIGEKNTRREHVVRVRTTNIRIDDISEDEEFRRIKNLSKENKNMQALSEVIICLQTQKKCL